MATDISLDVLTYSSATTLCLCEKKYHWRYERCLRPALDEEGEALVVGTAFHVGGAAYLAVDLDAGLKAIDEWRVSNKALGPDANRKLDEQAAKAKAMLRASALKWPRDDREDANVALERIVQCPIVNPETGRASRSFVLRGRVDGVVDGRLLDWKGVSDPDDFVRSKKIGYQIECYILALESDGVTVDSAEFRLITRPRIKFCGKDKDAQAYEDRCLEWLTSDPAALVHHELFVNPARTSAAREWLWSVSKRVLENRFTGRWLRNELACKTWNRDCEYLPLCLVEASGGDPEDLIARDYVKSDPHPELGNYSCGAASD